MQPFERLRYLARWSAEDDGALVSEAADCLAGFADDPAGLVVACRRLLVHHPSAAALWWLCARVLTATDAAEAAWDAWRRVNEDTTASRLAERLPFPHDDPVAALGWPDLVATALADRPDLDAVAIRRRTGYEDRFRHRLSRERSVRVVDVVEAAALEPSHLLVETTAASPSAALLPEATTELVDELRAGGTEVWLVAGVGRVLPERLFTSLRAQVTAHADAAEDVELVPLDRFSRVAGPAGLDPTGDVLRRVDCPIAPELLRLS